MRRIVFGLEQNPSRSLLKKCRAVRSLQGGTAMEIRRSMLRSDFVGFRVGFEMTCQGSALGK